MTTFLLALCALALFALLGLTGWEAQRPIRGVRRIPARRATARRRPY